MYISKVQPLIFFKVLPPKFMPGEARGGRKVICTRGRSMAVGSADDATAGAAACDTTTVLLEHQLVPLQRESRRDLDQIVIL